MKSLLSVLFATMLVFGVSHLPNRTLAQNEAPAEMPVDPEIMPEDEAPPPDAMPGDDEQLPPAEMPADPEIIPEDEAPPPVAMPGDDEQLPPIGEGEGDPNDNAAPMPDEAAPPDEE